MDATNVSPPRTKNEIVDHVPEMPDVPEIADNEEIELVGQIVSVVGDVCVVASEKEDQAPLDETTPLCSEERVGLGFVEEVFGPIIKPMYTMRYDKKVQERKRAGEDGGRGEDILPPTKKTLVPEKLYSKGYDNSGANDEEVNDDSEYSDDEAEAEAKRKKNPKQRKRKEKETGGGGVSASKLWEGFVPNINCLDIAGSKTRDLRCNLRLGKWHLWVA